VRKSVTVRRLISALIVLFAWTASAGAQTRPTGYASVFFDYVPNREETVELRPRLFVEEKLTPSDHIRLTLSGFAEGLVSRRLRLEANGATSRRRVTDAIVRVQDANLTLTWSRADIVVGLTRVIWGKLDEIQPTDVVNPLDVSRFFFEGRSEARLPVPLVRARTFVGGETAIEGVLVPAFRRGRFDQLDEPTSPFNPAAPINGLVVCQALGCPTLPPEIVDRQPGTAAGNLQGGVRLTSTLHRMDWGVVVYRGIEPFGLYELPALPAPAAVAGAASSPRSLTVDLTYPRFTMIGGDLETTHGKWGVRAEIAAFVDDHFQSEDLRSVSGHSFDGGAGVDRRAGSYTFSGTVLFHSESYDAPLLRETRLETSRQDLSFIVSADCTFARDKYRLRSFAVVNVPDEEAFLRAIAIAELRDNFAFEASAGWFAGQGPSLVGRFADSDFVYLRLKYYF
jgi:hypothetical protein